MWIYRYRGPCSGAVEVLLGREFSEGLAVIMQSIPEEGFKYGYIRADGSEAVVPKYDNAEDFSEGLAAVTLGGKWGYINTEGQEVVAPQYDEAGKFLGGKAAVCLDGKWGVIGIKEETSTIDTPAPALSNADKAEALKPLGVFVGTEKGFELERPATRMEAAVMLQGSWARKNRQRGKQLIPSRMFRNGAAFMWATFIRTDLQQGFQDHSLGRKESARRRCM